MPDCSAPPEMSAARALAQRLENALAEQRRHVLFASDDWQRASRLYAPLLEDLLSRTRRSQSAEEVRFLARQADRLLALCRLQGEPPVDAPEALVLSLPVAPLRRRMAHLARCLAHPDCQRELHKILGVPVAASHITPDDLLLRALARVLLQGWGARDIVPAPMPARGRPSWDLYSTELNLVVRARPRAQLAQPLAFASHRLTIVVDGAPPHQRLEAWLYHQPEGEQPLSWTGLRWDEEQRLRAASRRIVDRTSLTTAGRQLQRALTRLEKHFGELLGHYRPKAPWAWRPGRSRAR